MIHLSKSPQTHIPASLPHHDGLCIWLVIVQGLIQGLPLQPLSWWLLVVTNSNKQQQCFPFAGTVHKLPWYHNILVIALRRLLGLTGREELISQSLLSLGVKFKWDGFRIKPLQFVLRQSSAEISSFSVLSNHSTRSSPTLGRQLSWND